MNRLTTMLGRNMGLALAIALFYSVLRLLSEHEGTARKEMENAAIALLATGNLAVL